MTYEKEITGLLVFDLYNDVISEGGKIGVIQEVVAPRARVPYTDSGWLSSDRLGSFDDSLHTRRTLIRERRRVRPHAHVEAVANVNSRVNAIVRR